MDGIRARLTQRRQAVVWLIWLLCAGLWSVALLTSFPVQVKDAVLSPQAGYHASKLLHVSAYAFLGGFAAWLLPGHAMRFVPILFLSFHAFGTEYLQQFVALRTGSITDVGFNHLGLIVGLAVTWWKWLPNRFLATHFGTR
jgi:VanZ family protein